MEPGLITIIIAIIAFLLYLAWKFISDIIKGFYKILKKIWKKIKGIISKG